MGDYNQLPPVQPVEPPKNLEIILDSLFSFYVKHHDIPTTQLKINYRSNADIVQFTSLLGLYQDLKAHPANASRKLSGKIHSVQNDWCKKILNPDIVTATIIHHTQYEIAVSTVEAMIVANLVIEYYRMQNPRSIDEETQFWR